MNAFAHRANAERAAEHWCRSLGAIITRRAVRTRFSKVDFFGADVIGLTPNGNMIAIQATAGGDSAVTARRRKLETVPWHHTATVLVAQLRVSRDPANLRRNRYHFRVSQWADGRWSVWSEAPEIPREWFKALRECGTGQNMIPNLFPE